MATTDLYTLTYSARNYTRRVVYTSSPRQITNVVEAIDADQPITQGGQPDNWPYTEGQYIGRVAEGAESVKFYATRTAPYARYEVVGSGTVDDLQLSNVTQNANSISFAVSTSNQPWSSQLDSGAQVTGQSSYGGIPAGAHTITVTDNAGYSRQISFVVEGDPTGDDPEPGAAPAGAIVLRIRDKNNGDGTYQHYGYYWILSTRSVLGNYRLADSTNPQAYSRPQTDIVDRWCTDPGQPPYQERRAHHDAIDNPGSVYFEDVDGVTACQYLCAGSLTATPQGGAGRFSVTLTASGLTPPVRYRLDGGELQDEPVFDNLPPGRYGFEAVETRANGCTASTSITLTSAYGVRFRLNYDELQGVSQRLDIEERDYTGDFSLICGQAEPVTISQPGGATEHVFGTVKGSELEMRLLQTAVGQFRALYSGDERLHRVSHYRDGVLEWRGFLLPEQYRVAFLAPPVEFSLRATDGLGTLSTIPFVLGDGGSVVGDKTWLEIILLCLGKLNLGFPLRVLCSLYPVGADRTVSVLETVKVDATQYADNGKPWDCGAVVDAILTTLQARLYQERGVWYLERIVDLRTNTLEYFTYDADGQPMGLSYRGLLQTIAKDSPLYWIYAAQEQDLRPAVSYVSATEDVGELVNLLAPALPDDTDTALVNWNGDAPYQLIYQGKDKQPLIRLLGAQPGTPLASTKYLQTDLVSRVPLFDGGLYNDMALVVHLKAKAYGQYIPDQNLTPTQQEAQTAKIGVGLRYGSKWLIPTIGESDSVFLYDVGFPTNNEVDITIRGYGFNTTQTGAKPIAIRLTQATAGAAGQPVTVDVSLIAISWESASDVLADSYADRYEAETGQRVTRRDETLKLFHMDTRYARRQGTLLDVNGVPTGLWQEDAIGQALEIGAWNVANRALLQSSPAQVLDGTVQGYVGPGALITDPTEELPGVYLLTDWSRETKQGTVKLTGVQLLNLSLTPDQGGEQLPDYLLLTEDGRPLLSEAPDYLLREY